MSIDRRKFLFLIALLSLQVPAAAKDGDSGGNSGSGGGDDGGNSGSGGGDDGGDSDNSGPGNNNDDSDDDDRDDDDIDQDDALDAVRDGEIISLRRAVDIVQRRQPGRVIAVSLKRKDRRDIYSFKIKNPKGRIFTLQMNARTGTLVGN
ncbi:MAG TPA: PepSY domain-containing protein [Rhizobiaceae bacterium]|nr:PepSY domain-containing protein [Rhizobiaceae bacterium]